MMVALVTYKGNKKRDIAVKLRPRRRRCTEWETQSNNEDVTTRSMELISVACLKLQSMYEKKDLSATETC